MLNLSWNRLPRLKPERTHALHDRHAGLPPALPKPFITYGNGRSYGDVCLTDRGTLLLARGLDHFIDFDPATGVLRCEAGITLTEVLALVLPYGWFLPVTPGTQYVTLGGAVANDVHGKNHHQMGSFGHHVQALELLRSNGESIVCGPDENTGWFRATVGGLGLTGLIRWVEIRLMRVNNPYMWVASERFRHLDDFWQANEAAAEHWPYSVAWVDCTAGARARGRGIMLTGRHAGLQARGPAAPARKRRIPFDPPFSLLSRNALRLFNAAYYRQRTAVQGRLMHYQAYFYPLDAIQNWNRIYGRSGFYQYQCVVPPGPGPEAIRHLLDAIARKGEGSFLAVLKSFGTQAPAGMLSFPRPGYTLALDFSNRGERTFALFNELDSIVRDAGGALYPAKDARMPAPLFRSGFPEWETFSQFVDPAFSSHFWRRVST